MEPIGTENKKTHRCDHCERSYELVKLLNRHMREKHPEVVRQEKAAEDERKKDFQHQCTMCDERFPTRKILNHHRSRYHTAAERQADRPQLDTFKCEICDIGHKSKDALRMHMLRHHKN